MCIRDSPSPHSLHRFPRPLAPCAGLLRRRASRRVHRGPVDGRAALHLGAGALLVVTASCG
eukprot:3978436-Pleurochrysis_carterae.AAC.1